MSQPVPSNFSDDLRVPRTGEVTDAFPIDCENITINGVVYKRQRVATVWQDGMKQ